MLTEAGVKRLVKRVCAEIDPAVPSPSIFFREGVGAKDWRAEYRPASRTIVMPTPGWVKKYKAATSKGYREVVLHELAHHFFGIHHNKEFYHGLFGLCELYGVPLSLAYAEEYEYRPRHAARGLDGYLASLKQEIERRTP